MGMAALRGCYSSGALGGSVESRHNCEAEAREDTTTLGSSHYSVLQEYLPIAALVFTSTRL